MFGDIIGGLFGYASARANNKNNRSLARQANNFTREMMQNRHQWQVADMRAAGLNPILSAGGTPSMGASAQAAPSQDPGAAGLQAALSAKMLDKVQAEINKTKAETEGQKNANKKSKVVGDIYQSVDKVGRKPLDNFVSGAIRASDVATDAIGQAYYKTHQYLNPSEAHSAAKAKRIREIGSHPHGHNHKPNPEGLIIEVPKGFHKWSPSQREKWKRQRKGN